MKMIGNDTGFAHPITSFSPISTKALSYQNDNISSKEWLPSSPTTSYGLTLLPSRRHLITSCKRFAYAFVPQLLRSRIWHDTAPTAKEFPTSYLNGLRGITAIKVFTFHYLMLYTDFTLNPWRMDERHNRWILWPIIRYVYSGFTSQIFFACAGYLISLRTFQLLDRNDVASQSKVFSSMAGSLFRRAFRLYLPVLAITLLTTIHIHLGLYEYARPYYMDEQYTPGPFRDIRQDPMALWPQLVGWLREMYKITNITDFGTIYCEQDQHLWSIHAEMVASTHLFLCMMALALCKPWARLVGLIFLTIVYMAWDHWEIWMYLLAAIVAQIDIFLTQREAKQGQAYELLPSAQEAEKSRTTTSSPSRYSLLYRSLRLTAYLVAFYFMSFPVAYHFHSPGYEFLKSLIPEYMARKDKFYPNFGAALFLLLLVRGNPITSIWRRITNSHIALYLGSISFAIYLVHAPVLHWVGYMIPQWVWWSSGTTAQEVGEAGWCAALFLGWGISVILTLWAADVWAREVEGRCIRFTKKIESWCFR